MDSVKGIDIMRSYGDTFNQLFQIYNYILSDADTLTFNIKDGDDKVLLSSNSITIEDDGQCFRVSISSEQMKKVPVGTHFYDVLLTASNGAKLTLNFPGLFVVRKVSHDV